jgi:hypothetical protein
LKHLTFDPEPFEAVILAQETVLSGRNELPMSKDSPCQTFGLRGLLSFFFHPSLDKTLLFLFVFVAFVSVVRSVWRVSSVM